MSTLILLKPTAARESFADGQYPVGYNGIPFDELPPLCPTGQLYVQILLFILIVQPLLLTCSCPDESDKCINMSPVGGACQKDRDGAAALSE
jgi:hypothetical protein